TTVGYVRPIVQPPRLCGSGREREAIRFPGRRRLPGQQWGKPDGGYTTRPRRGRSTPALGGTMLPPAQATSGLPAIDSPPRPLPSFIPAPAASPPLIGSLSTDDRIRVALTPSATPPAALYPPRTTARPPSGSGSSPSATARCRSPR